MVSTNRQLARPNTRHGLLGSKGEGHPLEPRRASGRHFPTSSSREGCARRAAGAPGTSGPTGTSVKAVPPVRRVVSAHVPGLGSAVGGRADCLTSI